MKLESTLVGVAGEYLVAAELSMRGYIASITLRNSRGIDILASSPDGERSVSIQVKTNSSGSPTWMLNKKSEDYFSEDHFYVFVALTEIGQRPNFYVAPSEIVATFIRKYHQEWLTGVKKDGSRRRDSSMRKFIDSPDDYLERRELLRL